MKTKLFLFLFIIISLQIFSESIQISPYQNQFLLRELRNDVNDIYPESHIYIYIDLSFNKLIISSEENNYFGICNKDFSDILIDLDGDGIANESYEALNVPYWVINNNTVINSQNRTFLEDLNGYFQAFSSQIDIRKNPLYKEITIRQTEALQSKTVENRDLYYLIYLHSISHNTDSEWSPHAIFTLEEKVKERYQLSNTPPVIKIYQLEYFLRIRDMNSAILILDEMLPLYPENPVFKIYSSLYDPDSAVTLTEDDKKHWLFLNLKS